jgi:ATP-binding cassette subfamily B protein
MSRRRILSRLLDFVKPYKGRAIAGFTLAILTTAMSVARPYLTKPMMDDGLGMGPGRHANYATLMIYVAIFAALTLLTATFEGGWLRMMAGLGSRIARDLRVGVYGHLHRLSLSFFSRKPTGQLVTRVTSDTDRIWEFITFTLVEIAISLLTIVGVCTFLFVLNWRLACFVLVPIPIMVVLTFFFHGRLHTVIDRLVHRYGQMTAVISDALPGVRVVKAFGQERREVRRFGDKNDKYYDDDISCLTLWTLFGPLLQFCSQFGSLLIWTVGGYWVVRDLGKPNPAVTPGELLSFVGYMWMFYGPIHMLAHMDRALNRAASSVQRVLEILDTAPSIFSPTHARKLEQPRGEIELRDVSFSYDGIRRVLKNINLKIEAGKMIGLAGPSGGGKSTLINLICRFYDVLEGQILFDGTDVRDYDVESLRRRIGVVLQEPFLFFGTVGENIAYGSPEATMPQIIEAAKAANAHDFIVGFPDGYDTIVGERGHTLSGGERQRISIARAILGNPAVLILDEATSSVDTETEKLIQEAMDRLIAHRTTIAIAHRLSTLRKADRLVILENGAIAEEGSHEELAGKENGLYAKLLRTQTEMQSIIAIG